MGWLLKIFFKPFVITTTALAALLFSAGCGCEKGGDRTPPDTIIIFSPSNPAGSTTAEFEFTCDEEECVYECQVDYQGWEACESPKRYTGLSKTEHIFEVRAYDMAGNIDDTPASYTWSIITAEQVSTGDSHACAVLSDGRVKCWGRNEFGQLGDGRNIDSSVPVFVSGVDNAVYVSAAFYHTCAVLQNGAVKCWGRNDWGQLGDGTQNSSNIPVTVSGLDNVKLVSGGESHSCALLEDGSVKCWGLNMIGQVGTGESYLYYNTPQTVLGMYNIVSISAGGFHTCAVRGDGKAYCWGANFFGELGDGTNNNSFTPVEVTGITDAESVSSQSYHACAVLSDGRIKCWGENTIGELGNGTNVDSNLPVEVTGINNALSVTAGDNITCALLSDFSVSCWGAMIANGTEISINTPVKITGLDKVLSLDSGHDFTCAIVADYTVKCWGFNSYGQLGDGTTNESKTPVSVTGIP